MCDGKENTAVALSGMAIELSRDLLDSLFVIEKVRGFEQVWSSFCCQPDLIASSDWHAVVLQKRPIAGRRFSHTHVLGYRQSSAAAAC
jgi:hypothetical protein